MLNEIKVNNIIELLK